MGDSARPLSEWHEDIGPVLWWWFPVREPPYVGTPLDRGYYVQVQMTGRGWVETVGRNVGGWPGYHTHWTPLIVPKEPK